MSKEIGRRGILGLLAGIPGLIGLGAKADGLKTIGHEIGPFVKPEGWNEAPPEAPAKILPKHPIFAFQEAKPNPRTGIEQIHTLRVRYVTPKTDAEIEDIRTQMLAAGTDRGIVDEALNALKEEQGQRRLSIQILKEDVPAKRFATLRQAEADLFSHVEVAPMSAPTEPNTRTINPIMINRAANLIAARTRRGAGNVVLMHRDDLPLISGTGLAASTENRDMTIGRWWRVGQLNHTIDVWVTDDLPPGFSRRAALVGYRGNEMDAGGYLVQTDSGYGHVALPNSPSSMGNMSDYLQMVYLHTGEAQA